MDRLRLSEHVPAMREGDARRLRGLPASWDARVPEAEVDALKRRAGREALALERRGHRRAGAELRRLVSLLERADQLHRHAADIETIVGLIRALEAFAAGPGPHLAEEPGAAHGPAFRDTAALRNRAFRLLASALAHAERA